MKELIRRLTDILGPCGFEDAVRRVIQKEVRGLADETRVDALGNLIVRRGKRTAAAPHGQRIMVAVHMDEVGLIATHVDGKGFVRITGLGMKDASDLLGRPVRFMGGARGIIGLEPVEQGTAPTLDRMYVDVGATSPRDCPVKVGEAAGLDGAFLDLGTRVASRSMRGRLGCAVALEVLRKLGRTSHEIYMVFTVQQGLGEPGAQAAAYDLEPDIGFSIDVAASVDMPGMRDGGLALGAGPAITIRDGEMMSDARVVDWMARSARRNRIPCQRAARAEGTTDARAMQLSRAGVPVGGISIPCRYVHTGGEMVDMKDVHGGVKLVAALLRSPLRIG